MSRDDDDVAEESTAVNAAAASDDASSPPPTSSPATSPSAPAGVATRATTGSNASSGTARTKVASATTKTSGGNTPPPNGRRSTSKGATMAIAAANKRKRAEAIEDDDYDEDGDEIEKDEGGGDDDSGDDDDDDYENEKTTAKKKVSAPPSARPPKTVKVGKVPATDHRKKRRNRTTQSCLSCHQNKRKCDRGRPCGRCISLGLTGYCVYEVGEKGRSRETAVQNPEVDTLRTRVLELEGVVRELKNKPQPRWASVSINTAPANAAVNEGNFDFGAAAVAQNAFANDDDVGPDEDVDEDDQMDSGPHGDLLPPAQIGRNQIRFPTDSWHVRTARRDKDQQAATHAMHQQMNAHIDRENAAGYGRTGNGMVTLPFNQKKPVRAGLRKPNNGGGGGGFGNSSSGAQFGSSISSLMNHPSNVTSSNGDDDSMYDDGGMGDWGSISNAPDEMDSGAGYSTGRHMTTYSTSSQRDRHNMPPPLGSPFDSTTSRYSAIRRTSSNARGPPLGESFMPTPPGGSGSSAKFGQGGVLNNLLQTRQRSSYTRGNYQLPSPSTTIGRQNNLQLRTQLSSKFHPGSSLHSPITLPATQKDRSHAQPQPCACLATASHEGDGTDPAEHSAEEFVEHLLEKLREVGDFLRDRHAEEGGDLPMEAGNFVGVVRSVDECTVMKTLTELDRAIRISYSATRRAAVASQPHGSLASPASTLPPSPERPRTRHTHTLAYGDHPQQSHMRNMTSAPLPSLQPFRRRSVPTESPPHSAMTAENGSDEHHPQAGAMDVEWGMESLDNHSPVDFLSVEALQALSQSGADQQQADMGDQQHQQEAAEPTFEEQQARLQMSTQSPRPEIMRRGSAPIVQQKASPRFMIANSITSRPGTGVSNMGHGIGGSGPYSTPSSRRGSIESSHTHHSSGSSHHHMHNGHLPHTQMTSNHLQDNMKPPPPAFDFNIPSTGMEVEVVPEETYEDMLAADGVHEHDGDMLYQFA